MKKAFKIAVCGIGYVGLPVALLFVKKGYDVVGVDVDEDRVKKINRGFCPIKGREPGLGVLLKESLAKKSFRVTTNPEDYRDRDVMIVAVQTPVESKTNEPKYEHLKKALEVIAPLMKKGVLVVIESTIAPTTMEKVVAITLEKESGLHLNRDFMLANCPERVMPGRLLYNLTHYDRLVGAFNFKAGKLVKKLYEEVLGVRVDITDPLTAEIVKSGENAYRDVQIAFANEMALICEAYGADVWQVRELLNKCPYRQMHSPGAGVGGHCLPKDSWLLISGAKDLIETKLIPLARRINDFMPSHMFDLLKNALAETGKDISEAKIVILGYTYDANSDDTRNSPTASLVNILGQNNVEFVIQDPYVKEYKISLKKVLKGAGAIILMTSHDQYKKIKLKQLKLLMVKSKPIIIDGRNCFDKIQAQKLGFIYKGVGNI